MPWSSGVPNTVFPRIVSALEQFPPLNSFRTFMYCNQRSQYIRPNSKKNSFRGNYSRKYGIRHPWQLKKSKLWEPFWSYQLNSTANPAHLSQKWAKLAKLAVLFSWQLQNGSQDFDFFFNCNGFQLFYVKTIETHARAFLTLDILAIGRVNK